MKSRRRPLLLKLPRRLTRKRPLQQVLLWRQRMRPALLRRRLHRHRKNHLHRLLLLHHLLQIQRKKKSCPRPPLRHSQRCPSKKETKAAKKKATKMKKMPMFHRHPQHHHSRQHKSPDRSSILRRAKAREALLHRHQSCLRRLCRLCPFRALLRRRPCPLRLPRQVSRWEKASTKTTRRATEAALTRPSASLAKERRWCGIHPWARKMCSSNSSSSTTTTNSSPTNLQDHHTAPNTLRPGIPSTLRQVVAQRQKAMPWTFHRHRRRPRPRRQAPARKVSTSSCSSRPCWQAQSKTQN